jgi:hydroxymethylglutaryl-CoA reductase (NADPH)
MRAEVNEEGDLYGSVTLPNVVVGTVGGGTTLPDQSGYLKSIGLPIEKSANALAELAAALCMAGELSLAASICFGNFTRAHRTLARRRSVKLNRNDLEVGLKLTESHPTPEEKGSES